MSKRSAPDLVHVRGYLRDGTRINRRYKTMKAANAIMRRMSICHSSILVAIVLSDAELGVVRIAPTLHAG